MDREWRESREGRGARVWGEVMGRRETARMSLSREDEFAEFLDIDVEIFGVWNNVEFHFSR